MYQGYLPEKDYFYIEDINLAKSIHMHCLIFGATGTAGSEVVRQAIADPQVDKITIVVRRPVGFHHAKVNTVIHHDFISYKDMLPLFRTVNTCIWCLGISQTQVSKEQYLAITYDFVIAAATAMHSVNPEISFVFLSGQGADSAEKSKVLFAKVKGKAENALKLLSFKHIYIFRPGVIVPISPSTGKAWKYRMGKLIQWMAPKNTITTEQLARVMLYLAKNHEPSVLLENREIRAIVEKLQYKH